MPRSRAATQPDRPRHLADELREFVGQAASLQDRIGSKYVPVPGREQQAARRLATWERHVGGKARFQDRLALEGIQTDRAREAVGPVCFSDAEALPPWADVFAEAYLRVPRNLAVQRGAPPFAELVASLVDAARGRAVRAAGAARSTLGHGVWEALSADLRARLLNVGAQTFHATYRLYGTGEARPRVPGRPDGEDGYAQYLRRVLGDGGLPPLYGEYPVLARLLSVAALQWVQAAVEFAIRLRADQDELDAVFGVGASPAVAVSGGLSDAHNGGRTVAVVSFASGRRIVYKPRGLRVEQLFQEVVRWVNRGRPAMSLPTLDVLDRGAYGWCEYVDPSTRMRKGGAGRFYHRAGMLLAIAHALRASDLHFENVMAQGEHPFLVDLEALGHRGLDSADEPASVLSTGLLPRWHPDGLGSEVDVSGFGYDGSRKREGPRGGMEAPPPSHLPHSPTGAARPHQHLREMTDGFVEGYRILSDRGPRREELEDVLRRFGDAEVRFLFRHTSTYGRLSWRTLHPQFLRDGVDRSLEFEVLAPTTLGRDGSPARGRLFLEERAALERLDIPAFVGSADETGPRIPGSGLVRGVFERSALDGVLERLGSLSESDLGRQVEIIQSAFAPYLRGETSVRTPAGA